MVEDAQVAEQTQVEAAAPETVPAVSEGREKTVTTTVWAASGPVAKASILQTAIQAVRDAIPVVYGLKAEITGDKKTTRDKQDGTAFEVTITYTPRNTGGKADPVDLDKVVRSLDVPTALPDTHPGAPGFLD